jgi:hypothetical protein
MHVAGLAQSACAIKLKTDSYQLLQAVLLQTDTHLPLPLLPGHQQQQAQGAQGPGLAAAPGSLPCSKHIQADIRGWHVAQVAQQACPSSYKTSASSQQCGIYNKQCVGHMHL